MRKFVPANPGRPAPPAPAGLALIAGIGAAELADPWCTWSDEIRRRQKERIDAAMRRQIFEWRQQGLVR